MYQHQSVHLSCRDQPCCHSRLAKSRGSTEDSVIVLHEHINSSAKADAVLFSIQDAPVLQALGLYYEEEFSENGGHQKVTAAFSA